MNSIRANLGRIWQSAPVDLQQKVQNTLFPGGLEYDPEKGILNEDNHVVFNQLREMFLFFHFGVSPDLAVHDQEIRVPNVKCGFS